jgi:hypothetical protein
MTTPPLSPENYIRVTAIITHATLKRTIETAYPDLSPMHQDEMMIDVIGRIARMRGWSLKTHPDQVSADGESD